MCAATRAQNEEQLAYIVANIVSVLFVQEGMLAQ
jgi:hypothetical protein